MATDLGELVRARLAAKIEQGKSPSKADIAWLDATQERPPAESSVELARNAKGEMQFSVKVYAPDPLHAEDTAKQIAARLRATFPMGDGTVGSPMRDEPGAKGAK
jgi:hypothetical protein